MAADHRSILPSVAGLPWWSAVAVAVVTTAIGVAFDAGSGAKELTTIFAALYVMGCVAAVLMVEQSGVFTTVIQPPLILFVTVPGAYWLFRGAGFPGLKAIVINCGYPLIERFPLMLFTAAAVLLIGMVRWYLGMLSGTATRDAEDRTSRHPTLVDKLRAALTSALNRNPAHAIEPSTSRATRQQRSGGRTRRATAESRRAAREAGSGRSRTRSSERRGAAKESAPTRSRHIRPTMDGPAAERPRQRRSATEQPDQPLRRRPRPEVRDERTPRRRPAPEWQDEPPRQRPRPSQDSSRGSEPMPRADRDQRTRSYRPEASEPPPRRRQASAGAAGRDNGAGGRHPVSQVRYRKAAGDESGARPRPPRGEADSWKYDI